MGEQQQQRPILLRADRLQLRPDRDAQAEGHVEVRRAGTVITADRLVYDSASDLATARGQVVITREGVRYSGPELQLQLQRFEGHFLQPTFEFTRLGAGGVRQVEVRGLSRTIIGPPCIHRLSLASGSAICSK